MSELSFTPCDERCPAVTGKSYGSLKYCPMLENTRHKSLNLGSFPPESYDVRYKDDTGINPFYSHNDYTDCCLNFQCCCPEEAEQSVLQKIAESASIGKGMLPVYEY